MAEKKRIWSNPLVCVLMPRIAKGTRMARGDHIITPMVAYSHHGIDIGDGTVVHWTTPAGQSKRCGIVRYQQLAEIRHTSVAEFSGSHPVWVREYTRCFDSETAVARALAL